MYIHMYIHIYIYIYIYIDHSRAGVRSASFLRCGATKDRPVSRNIGAANDNVTMSYNIL